MIIEMYDSVMGYPDGFEFFITAKGETLQRFPSGKFDRHLMQVVLERGPSQFPTDGQMEALKYLVHFVREHEPELVALYMGSEWKP